MARIRSIKPEFWTSEQVMECSRDARLLFIGLWNFADDTGRHPFNPKQIKALVFPGDDDPVRLIEQWLGELEKQGLIAPYEAAGKRYLQITGWHHQKIDRPQAPKCPEPTTKPRENAGTLDDHSSNTRRPFATDRIGRDRIGREGSSSLRSEPAPNGALLKSSIPEKPDTAAYRRGKALLGPKLGGKIVKALIANSDDLDDVSRALTRIETSADPPAYAAAILRNYEHPESTDDWIT